MAGTELGESVAYIYAEALYDVAAESGTVAETEQELLSLSNAMKGDVRLHRFLETPTVSVETKRKVLTAALSGLSKPVLNLILLAIEHGRIGMFDGMVEAYHRHANGKAGIAEIEVASARPLDSAEHEQLKAMLHTKLKQKIVLKEHVRPALLGGLILTHAGRSWDGSVAHRLGRLVDKIEATRAEAKIVE